MGTKGSKKKESASHIRWVCLYLPLVVLFVVAATILQIYIAQPSGSILMLSILISLLAAAYLLAKRSSSGSRKSGK